MIYGLIFRKRFVNKMKDIRGNIWRLLNYWVDLVIICAVYGYAMAGKESVAGMRFCDVVTYLMFSMTVSCMAAVTGTKLSSKVRKDRFMFEMLYPYSYRWKVFVETGADVCSGILVSLLPMFLLVWAGGYLVFPADFMHVLLFVVCLVLGEFLWRNLILLFEMIGFWYKDMVNIFFVVDVGCRLFGGVLMPYCFFPKAVSHVLKCTPLYGMMAFPMDIYFGRLSYLEIGFWGVVQCVWIGILLLVGKVVFEGGKRKLQMAD